MNSFRLIRFSAASSVGTGKMEEKQERRLTTCRPQESPEFHCLSTVAPRIRILTWTMPAAETPLALNPPVSGVLPSFLILGPFVHAFGVFWGICLVFMCYLPTKSVQLLSVLA